MALITNKGLLSGRLGGVIFYVHHGKQLMKAVSEKKPKDPQSPAQQISRQKFKVATQFACKSKDVIRIGYQANMKMTAMNEFVSHLYHDAIEGIYPFQGINYPRVKFSRGSIPAPHLIVAELGADNLVVSWKADLDDRSCRPNDELALVLVNKYGEVFSNLCLANREDQSAVQQLPDNFKDTFFAWAFYQNPHKSAFENKNRISDSVYLGMF